MTEAAVRPIDPPRGAADRLRVLMLAFEFPPSTAGGVYRAVKLAEYLPERGVDLQIVTVRAEDHRQWAPGPLDPSLLDALPSSVTVHRISYGFPSWFWRLSRSRLGHRALQYMIWGDPVARFWRKPLFAFLDSLMRSDRPDVLLSTAPPFGVAVLAHDVARRYGLPWVSDWRDPWTFWSYRPFPTFLHYLIARRQERRALRGSNVSVTTSHVTREEWHLSDRELSRERTVTIYNGYDEYTGPSAERSPPGDGARIVYVGSWYYDPAAHKAMLQPWWKRAPHRWLHYRWRIEDWLYRSPYFFLRGLRRFAEREPAAARRLEVIFAGRVPSWLPAMLKDTGTRELVQLVGHVSHGRALALQADATALLLTSAKIPGGRDYSIAGKTFEYIGSRKPILGLLADGAMRDLVARAGTGILVDPDDTEGVARAIHAIADGRVAMGRLTPDQERFIGSLGRREMARQMAEQLRRAAGEGPLLARSARAAVA